MFPYRVQQVYRFFSVRLQPQDVAWLKTLLSPAEQTLFFAQQVGDQAHAMTVARTLEAQGDTDRRLLQAALLHDTGKAPGVSVAHRTLLVLLKYFAPERLRSLTPTTTGWLAPLARGYYHPMLGANLAEEAGSHPDVVTLIRYHQDKQPPLKGELEDFLRKLQAVDDVN